MARVVVAQSARQDLDSLMRSHSLPASTRDRVRRSIEPLASFPLLGPALSGRWDGFRIILGSWTWMLIVYMFLEAEDLVVIVTIQDARTATAARSTE